MEVSRNKTEIREFLNDRGFQESSVITVRVSDLLNQLSVLTRNSGETEAMEDKIMEKLNTCSNAEEEVAAIRMEAAELLKMYDVTSENDIKKVSLILNRNRMESGITTRIDMSTLGIDGTGIVFGDEVYPFHRGEIYGIGRGDSNAIVIRANYVSRRHCEIKCDENGNLKIRDLSSTNGTFINDLRLEPNVFHGLEINDVVGVSNMNGKVVQQNRASLL